MKMAYEFAFLWLGDDYLGDPCRRLAKAIMSDDPHSTDALKGYVGPAEECTAFQFWNPHRSRHLAYGNAVRASFSFGSGVRYLRCLNAGHRSTAKYISSRHDQNKVRFVTVDATSRQVLDTTFNQESRRMASEMTRLRRKPPFPDALGHLLPLKSNAHSAIQRDSPMIQLGPRLLSIDCRQRNIVTRVH